MQFFKSADKNHDGMINREELIEICHKFSIDFDVETFFNLVDVNKDQEVNYSEFLMAAFDFQKNLTKDNIK